MTRNFIYEFADIDSRPLLPLPAFQRVPRSAGRPVFFQTPRPVAAPPFQVRHGQNQEGSSPPDADTVLLDCCRGMG